MAPQVFISYASADKTIADRVCETLEESGVSCWIAPRDIPAGMAYPAAIVEAVQSVRVLVLVLTEHATGSPHILSEVGHAFSGKKRIIPFRLSVGPLPEDLEYFLSVTQWLDAPEGCTDASLKRLTDATQEALAGRRTVHGPVPVGQRARWLVVAGTIAALVVGTAAVFYWKSHRAGGDANAIPPNGVTSTPSRSVSESVPEAAPVAAPDAARAGTKPKTWLNPADGQTYVWIPPGEFTMGCSEADSECGDDEKPTHPVSIDKGFWLGQTEVTRAAYGKFVARHGGQAPEGDSSLPATEVTRAEAKTYCAAVGGRLPTEAEWEYAARGGKPHAYYGVVPEIAWYAGNSGDAPHPVGKKRPNANGLYDMLGNVREWVLDRYYNKYDVAAPATGEGVQEPLAPNAWTVARGGFFESEPAAIRVSHRSALLTDSADPTLGWRCARDHR
jgi:formylglycine-generating enzyme required for sulfatase activity